MARLRGIAHLRQDRRGIGGAIVEEGLLQRRLYAGGDLVLQLVQLLLKKFLVHGAPLDRGIRNIWLIPSFTGWLKTRFLNGKSGGSTASRELV